MSNYKLRITNYKLDTIGVSHSLYPPLSAMNVLEIHIYNSQFIICNCFTLPSSIFRLLASPRLPFARCPEHLGKRCLHLLPHSFEVQTPDMLLHYNVCQIGYALLSHNSPELICKRRGNDGDGGNSFLFENKLVNYQR